MAADSAIDVERVLILRSCLPGLKSQNNFQWPESGEVAAPDWDPKATCGGGLHGWLWGVGDFSIKVNEVNARWLVVEVEKDSVIQLDGKVKFPRGNVIFCGSFAEAFLMVRKSAPDAIENTSAQAPCSHAGAQDHSGHASAMGKYSHANSQGVFGHAGAMGESGHASAQGKYGNATAQGRSSHASALGDSGHASAQGDSGLASALGDSGHANAQGRYANANSLGESGHANTQGISGQASAKGKYGHAGAQGDSGLARSQGDSGHAGALGDSGHASALGKYGKASALGYSGHASALGKYGVAAALHDEGMARAGEDGSIILSWWDGDRYRHVVGYVGEDGIKANTWYCVLDGKLSEWQIACERCDMKNI